MNRSSIALLAGVLLVLVSLRPALAAIDGPASNPPDVAVASAACLGDVNGDGVVNLVDLVLVSLRLGAKAGDPSYDARYDLNNDGKINLSDVRIVASRLGTVCGGASPTPTRTATASHTSTATRTITPTYTATRTATFSPTATRTATSTPTHTPTHSPTATPTATATATLTAMPTATGTATATATPRNGPPPDPADIAPDLDGTVATDIFSSTSFLYEGADAIQTGVAPGTIEFHRVAVLRGRVLDRAGQPLPGVAIEVLDHPEFGQTQSRDDGMFDLAVNGGGRLVLDYARDGYLPAQRSVDAPWRDFAFAPDVVLVELDPVVTTVDLTAPGMQTARGSEETDTDGSRQATLFIPQGTTASMVLPDGSTQALTSLDIRATEFTVGENGPKAMPAELPPTSGYTYAVELSADEVIAAGGTRLDFNQPIPVYVENFIDFPVGATVPAGFYDRELGQWVPSANGKVVEVVSVTAGMADLDIDGDGLADDASSIGVTPEERSRLGALYAAGEELWRVPVSHFTPWDFNWPYGPPSDSIPPPNDPLPEEDPKIDDPHEDCGSTIGCESQTLGESVPVTGTGWDLNYNSGRTPGRTAARALLIPVSGAGPLPASLLKMRLEIDIAGQHFEASFAPATDISYPFTWDGKDAYGRLLLGRRSATIKVHYDYQAQYYPAPADFAASFGRPGFSFVGAIASGRRGSTIITSTQTRTGYVLGTWDARAAGLGGWDLTVHHAYDPGSRLMLFGDGSQRSGASMANIVTTVAGNGTEGTSADGGLATNSRIHSGDVAAAPDGSFYFTDGSRIRRVSPDGLLTTVAGSVNSGFAGDGGPATSALLEGPSDLALGPDGSIYFIDMAANSLSRIRRIDPDGIITTVAGNGTYNFCGDGGPATAACLGEPQSIDVGPDGSLYIADFRNYRIRKVGTDGIINTIAGTLDCYPGFGCYVPSPGDGGPATRAGINLPRAVAVGPDGSLYISAVGTDNYGRIRRVTPDGVITTIAGGGTYDPPFFGDGGPATAAFLTIVTAIDVAPDGGVFLADTNYQHVRYVGADGIITSVAGFLVDDLYGWPGFNGDGGPALGTQFNYPASLALASDGSLLVSDSGNHRIRRIAPALPDISLSDVLLPSQDGTELYLFSSAGRHLRTLHALTGAVLQEFGYDADGYLESITDGDGNVTTIERSGAVATAIVAPGGQRTELTINADGWLTRAANPASEAHTMTYHGPEGLLASLTDPMSNVHAYLYDSGGRLTLDDDPAAGSTTLARTELPDGFQVTTTSELGRVRTYRVQKLPTRQIRRTAIDPTGATTVSNITTGLSQQTTYPGGATTSAKFGPDPRWRMLVPVITNVTTTTPGGKTRNTTSTRTASLADPANLLSLTQLTETVTDNGNTRTRVYDAATRTFTMTTAEGRTVTLTLDLLGRMVNYRPDPGVAPVIDTYDAKGRLSLETQGSLTQSFGYDALNRMTSSTDAGGHVTLYEYDAADRISAVTTPGDDRYEFTYDANGNMLTLEMPSGAVHSLGYTALDQGETYTPPGGGTSTDRTYDADRAWTGSSLASGRSLSASYDAAGRPSGRDYAEALVTMSYADATYRLSSMTRTPITGIAQTDAYTFDANLPLTATSNGASAGAYSYTYDNLFRLTSMNLTTGGGSSNIALVRDKDGLITSYGPFAITHNGPAGAANSIADGAMTITNTYDALGRLSERKHVVGGVTAYQLNLSYDAAGLIGERTETTAGGAETRTYTYDSEGQLTQVEAGGSAIEEYSYDTNGNRSSNAASATYDAQDRVTVLAGITRTYDADGYLATRGADTFQYSARGELLTATVNGATVNYMYDALGRRVSRSDGAGTTQYLYGNPQNSLQVTASIDPAGVLAAYYYHGNGLFALERGGTRYYVASDNVGSPRVITDGSGAVVKTLQYDSYGNLLSDSNTAFTLSIGYAGGIADHVTGLVHFGFRDYDPSAGQWTARDPSLFGGSLNLYAYVNGDPVNTYDPAGLWAITVGFNAYEGIGGGASITFGSDGIKGCLEGGVGVGGGLEAGFAESVGNTDFTFSALAEASVTLGTAKLGVGYEGSKTSGNPCWKHEGKITQSLAPGLDASVTFGENGPKQVKGKVGLKELGLDPPPSPNIKGAGIGGKLAIKACAGTNW